MRANVFLTAPYHPNGSISELRFSAHALNIRRMIKRSFSLLLALAAAGLPCLRAADSQINTLTAAEKAAGWVLFFSGATFDGWHNFKSDAANPGWQVKDARLVWAAPH